MSFSCLDLDFLAQYFKIDCTFSETHPIKQPWRTLKQQRTSLENGKL